MKPLPLIITLLLATSAAAQAPRGYWPPGWSPYWRQPSAEPRERATAEAAPAPAAAPSAPPPPPPTGEPDTERLRETDRRAAVTAMREGNYAIAYYHWLPLAEAGDAESQFGIGWMYHNGYGLVIDNRKTLQWWSRAAQQGHLDAMFALGLLYAAGDEEVVKDPNWAADLYLKAARGGHEEARAMLAELLSEGGAKMTAFTAGWADEDWELFGSPLRISASRANFRAEPKLGSRVLAVLARGERLIEVSREGEWIEAVVPKRNLGGWIHGSLAAPPEDAAGGEEGAAPAPEAR